ncbi:MAG: hypothetical protein O7B25_08905 [Gammaproteobacteria bacterium]|nr:hypothetical protein [Gammaproteobacteria bacterium]
MIHSIRLSRLTHPRATLIAIVLLAVVLGLFGIVASALHPELSTTTPVAMPHVVQYAAGVFERWSLGF